MGSIYHQNEVDHPFTLRKETDDRVYVLIDENGDLTDGSEGILIEGLVGDHSNLIRHSRYTHELGWSLGIIDHHFIYIGEGLGIARSAKSEELGKMQDGVYYEKLAHNIGKKLKFIEVGTAKLS